MKKANPILLAALAVALVSAPLAYAENNTTSTVKARTFLGLRIGEDDHPSGNTPTGEDDQVEHRPIDKVEVGVDMQAHVDMKSRERATSEIDRRVASLQKLQTRIGAMKRVSDANKVSITASINNQVSVLTTLKAKIIADTDDATLKADIESITKSYRIYMLVIPQGMVLATADRISSTTDLMTAFGTKLEARMTEAQTAGHDIGVLNTTYVEYKAKIADAKVQATAAINLVAALRVDNGDQATIDANKKAIADAQAKLKVARTDLQTARKDADTIVKALKGFNLKIESSTKASLEKNR